jgi:hypothetical protein
MFDLHLTTNEERHRRKEEAKRNKQNRKNRKEPAPRFTKERAAKVKRKAEEAKRKEEQLEYFKDFLLEEQLEKSVQEEGEKAERVKISKQMKRPTT